MATSVPFLSHCLRVLGWQFRTSQACFSVKISGSSEVVLSVDLLPNISYHNYTLRLQLRKVAMKLGGNDRKILETLFEMSGGSVADFTNRTMEEFFRESFDIEIYSSKYDRENRSGSKANRLRGIWDEEDEVTVGKIVYSLIEYMEVSSLTNGIEISQSKLLLIQKAKEVAAKLIVGPNTVSFHTEAKTALEKSKIINDFTGLRLEELALDKKIYLLKIFCSYYEAIIRAYYGAGLFFLTSGIDELNVSFKVLRRKLVELILSEPSFEELKNSDCYQALIDPMTSLYSSPSFLEGVWDDAIQQYLTDFREMVVDKDLFENNSKVHSFDKSVALLLNTIKEEVIELRNLMKKKEEHFYQQFSSENNEQTESNQAKKRQEPIIKHEHRHIFENSIQEKEIAISVDDRRNSKGAKNKFPYTIPAGTEWRQVSMKVLEDEKVHIQLPSKEYIATYEEMGFGKNNGKPSVLWDFFKVLASQNGEMSIKDKTAKVQYKKQKQQISDALKNYFSMESDPFHPYKENSSYKTRFTLFSDTIVANGGAYTDDRKVEDNHSDIADYMNEIAPII
jgi:hypothetical protein